VPVVALALVLALRPGIERAKEERARSEKQQLEQARAARIERIRAEQRPRFARGPAGGADLAARERLLEDVVATVRRDARRRAAAGALDGPILRVECEPFPRTADSTGADQDPSRRFGRYACLAVTSDIPGATHKKAGAVGHPYRVRIDFESGRYGFCKVTGYASYKSELPAQAIVTVPRACGGS
jgi:hypothetical protein